MKFFYDLSKVKDSKTFPHDAPLIKGAQIGLIVFLVISSLTVFSGVRSHLYPYLLDSWFFVRWTVYAVSYFVGSLAPDFINSIVAAYMVSALLRKDYKGFEAKVLIAFCAVLCVGLTYYSFSMSQNSAVVIGHDIEKESTISDAPTLSAIDTLLSAKLASIEAAYIENYNRTNQPFKDQLSNISRTFDGQIAVLQSQIQLIDKNATKDNYLYAAKTKKPITEQIQKLESDKLASIAPVLERQRIANDTLSSHKAKAIQKANELHQFDRNRTTATTDGHNAKTRETSSIFSDLFSSLSAYAIFVVLLLTVIRSILFHRNDITPKPVLSNFDFGQSWLLEVVSFPFVYLRNHSINKVRSWYDVLPEIAEPVIESSIYDGNSLQQIIAPPDDKYQPIVVEENGEEIEINMSMNLDTENGENVSVITAAPTSKKIKGNKYVCARDGCGVIFTANSWNHSYHNEACKMQHHAAIHGQEFDPTKYKPKRRK